MLKTRAEMRSASAHIAHGTVTSARTYRWTIRTNRFRTSAILLDNSAV
jgi:hypothetical protein